MDLLRVVNAALKRELRARAHSLKPFLVVADRGLQDSVIAEADRALEHHELIKVRLRHDREARAVLAIELCERTGAALIQSVGQVVTIYKPRPAPSPSDTERSTTREKSTRGSKSKTTRSSSTAWRTATSHKRASQGNRGTRQRSASSGSDCSRQK